MFEQQPRQELPARYRAGSADDLYALGVTACLLLTGEYPEFAPPRQDEKGRWHLERVMLPAALMQGIGVEPRLRALILRMLSVRPEDRGPTAQLAAELERAAELAEAGASGAGGEAESFTRPAPARRVRPWLALAAVGLALAVWTWKAVSSQPVAESSAAEAQSAGEGTPDDGPTGLGEAAAATSLEEPSNSSHQEVLTEEAPPEPRPGQTRPDVKGR